MPKISTKIIVGAFIFGLQSGGFHARWWHHDTAIPSRDDGNAEPDLLIASSYVTALI